MNRIEKRLSALESGRLPDQALEARKLAQWEEIADLLHITLHEGEDPTTAIIYAICARSADVNSKETILARMNEWVGDLAQRSQEAAAIATGR